MDFKILTYNISHGLGLDKVIDVKRQAELIKSLEPDVACIQEIDVLSNRTLQIDEISILSKYTKMPYSAMGTNIIFKEGYYGNGILSKYPILNTMNYLFPKLKEENEQRGYVYSKVYKDKKIVHIYSIHLSVYKEERIRAINYLTEVLNKINSNEYILIAGDFNFGVEKVGNHQYIINMTEEEQNAFNELENVLNRIDNTELTWYSKEDNSCIDTIFYSKNITLTEHRTIKNDYSDHSIVYAEFKLN